MNLLVPVGPQDAVISRFQFSIVGKSDSEPTATIADIMNLHDHQFIH